MTDDSTVKELKGTIDDPTTPPEKRAAAQRALKLLSDLPSRMENLAADGEKRKQEHEAFMAKSAARRTEMKRSYQKFIPLWKRIWFSINPSKYEPDKPHRNRYVERVERQREKHLQKIEKIHEKTAQQSEVISQAVKDFDQIIRDGSPKEVAGASDHLIAKMNQADSWLGRFLPFPAWFLIWKLKRKVLGE